MTDFAVDKVADFKGLACPMPVVKMSKEIKTVDIGQIIEVLSTDPGSLSDIPAWAKSSGNEFLGSDQEGNVIKLYVKRQK